MAAVIGQTYFMLGHKLKNETKQKIKTTVNTRVFEPMRLMFANKNVLLASSWYKVGSNWNAVCWSGVTIFEKTIAVANINSRILCILGNDSSFDIA
jgi:hypothetical protein